MSEQSIKLVPVQEEPFNAETPLEALGQSVTPTPLFFVRNHFGIPAVDANTWRVVVDGEVERPHVWTLRELHELPHRTLTATLECAGNGRTRMEPRPEGTPWNLGAVSTASFTGAPLSAVLDRAGVRPGAVEWLFTGADRGEVAPGRVESFQRSLPLEVARREDVLLAWAMNDEPLTPEHGFPLRLVVPGWYGVASVKWLTRILAISSSFEGFYQKEHYVYVGERGTPDGTPVTSMRVRAVIASPPDGAELSTGPVELEGSAWSGAVPIERVEISTDGGATWTSAALGRPSSPYAAVRWKLAWMPAGPGDYTLVARAVDAAGNVQREESTWNAGGYGNNVVHRVRVRVL